MLWSSVQECGRFSYGDFHFLDKFLEIVEIFKIIGAQVEFLPYYKGLTLVDMILSHVSPDIDSPTDVSNNLIKASFLRF